MHKGQAVCHRRPNLEYSLPKILKFLQKRVPLFKNAKDNSKEVIFRRQYSLIQTNFSRILCFCLYPMPKGQAVHHRHPNLEYSLPRILKFLCKKRKKRGFHSSTMQRTIAKKSFVDVTTVSFQPICREFFPSHI